MNKLTSMAKIVYDNFEVCKLEYDYNSFLRNHKSEYRTVTVRQKNDYREKGKKEYYLTAKEFDELYTMLKEKPQPLVREKFSCVISLLEQYPNAKIICFRGNQKKEHSYFEQIGVETDVTKDWKVYFKNIDEGGLEPLGVGNITVLYVNEMTAESRDRLEYFLKNGIYKFEGVRE